MAFSGVNTFSAIAPTVSYWAIPNGLYMYGTSGSIANGSDAGMGRLRGVKGVEISEAEPERLFVTGDNGVVTSFTLQPAELPTGTITTGVQDQLLVSKASGQSITTQGDFDILGIGPSCYSFSQFQFLFNSPAKSLETASAGESGWVVTGVMKAENFASGLTSMTERAAMEWVNNLTLTRASGFPWGQSFVSATHGSSEYFAFQLTSPNPVTMHTFVADGSTTSFTLDETPTAASGTAVVAYKNGTLQTYTTHYTVTTATKTVSLAAAGSAGDKWVFVYQFVFTC